MSLLEAPKTHSRFNIQNPKLGDVVFLEEAITPEVCREIFPLLQSHWDEVSHPAFKDFQKLNPDFDKYIRAGQTRGAILYTVREVVAGEKPDSSKVVKRWTCVSKEGQWFTAGDLLGYWVFFINDTLHYMGTKQALGDVLFIRKDKRGRMAYEFVNECLLSLKAEGVQVVHAYCKKAHDLTHFFVDGFGMEQIDLHFTKRL